MINDASPPQQGLVKLRGTLSNYRCTRGYASFVFTQTDRNTMGMVAIAAGMAGLSGPAISTAAYAGDTEEEADQVEFELNGQPVKGWVWRSPFKEGDEVEVAAEWRGDHYEVAGIVRPKDRTIALYPHCSRGRARHIRNSIFWWGAGTTGALVWATALGSIILNTTEPLGFGISMLLLLTFAFAFPILWLRFGTKVAAPVVLTLASLGLYQSGHFFLDVGMLWVVGGLYAFFAAMTFSLARKWMPFVDVAERVFKTLSLPNPGRIDLVKSSKAQRTEQDPDEFGTFYFRY